MTENSKITESGNNPVFPGKIAVITGPPSLLEDDFHSPDLLIRKYGKGKVVHIVWPDNQMSEEERMSNAVSSITDDEEIRVLIINQALKGTNAAVEKFRKTRKNVFVIFSKAHEDSGEAVKLADLLFRPNEPGMGSEMVHQAKKQGAKTFVHYSFPRHMAIRILAARRDITRETCEAVGIRFVDAEVPDPTDEAGVDFAAHFIKEDVPKLVAKYGEDTAFFCTNCTMQTQLIRSVIDSHAIFTQPCCPSPYHGFPEAMGIKTAGDWTDVTRVITEASRIAGEKNMTDRISTWPVSSSAMSTCAGAEYAIKWLNGEVPETGIDDGILFECMSDYITEVIGEESNVYMKSYTEDGVVYENYKVILMSYLDF